MPNDRAPKNSNSRRPSFQFYHRDWLTDQKLKLCSYKDVGIFSYILCIMQDCEPAGTLTIDGRKMTVRELSRLTSIHHTTLTSTLTHLLTNGVLKEFLDGPLSGVLYNKRMYEDNKLSESRKIAGEKGARHGHKGAKYGHLGGRPSSVKGVNETPLKTPQKPPPSSSSSSSPPKETLGGKS